MILRGHDSHACAMHAHGRIIGNCPCSLSLSLALQDSLLTRHHPPKRATTLRRCVGVDTVRHDTLPNKSPNLLMTQGRDITRGVTPSSIRATTAAIQDKRI